MTVFLSLYHHWTKRAMFYVYDKDIGQELTKESGRRMIASVRDDVVELLREDSLTSGTLGRKKCDLVSTGKERSGKDRHSGHMTHAVLLIAGGYDYDVHLSQQLLYLQFRGLTKAPIAVAPRRKR